MPRNPALTSAELAALANVNQTTPYYLSFVPDVALAHATIADTPTTFPITTLSTTSESTHWADGTIRVGQTVKITSSDGLTLRGYYRVRFASPIAGTFYIDEISNADPGMIAQSSRSVGITSGDLITAYERWDPWAVLPVTIGATDYQDYNQVVSTHNAFPDPIVRVAFQGVPDLTHYMCLVANGGTKVVTATISIDKWPTDGSSTITYSWTLPASWTSTSGTSTATVTGTVPVGAYWIYCTVSSSAGGVLTIQRFVRIHSPADPPVQINITSDSRDRVSRKITIRAVNSRISVIPDGALCFVWTDGTWGGSDVPTASHLFVGYLYRQPFMQQPGYYESNAELLGPMAVLDLLIGLPAYWSYTGATTSWSQLAISTIQHMMWWILRWRIANILTTHNFTPFNTSASVARRKKNNVNAGSVASQLKYLAAQYYINIGSRSNGEIICELDPSLQSDRSGIPNRMTLDNSIYSDINVEWTRRTTTGLLTTSGVWSDLTNDYQIASAAPGLKAYGQGGNSQTEANNTYDSQDQANGVTGRRFAYLNNPYAKIKVTISNNWDVLEPADIDILTVAIPANKSPTGSAISIDCCCVSVDKTWIPGRRSALVWTLEGITDGLGAETAPVPPANQLSGPYSFTPIAADSGVGGLPTSPGFGGSNTNAPLTASVIILLTTDGFVAIGN